MWLFSLNQSSWSSLTSSNAPSPRAFFSAVKLENGFAIFGGKSTLAMYDEVWIFEIEKKGLWYWFSYVLAWKLVFRGTLDPFASPYPYLINIQCHMITVQEMACTCGTSLSDDPSEDVFAFNFATLKWRVIANFAASGFARRDGCGISSISNSTLVLFGGAAYSTLTNELLVIEGSTMSTLPVSSNSLPSVRSGVSLLTHGNRLFVFDGVGPIHALLVRSTKNVLSTVWELPLGPVCNGASKTSSCYQCAPGTFVRNNKCFECPQGTYSNSFGAISCTPWYV